MAREDLQGQPHREMRSIAFCLLPLPLFVPPSVLPRLRRPSSPVGIAKTSYYRGVASSPRNFRDSSEIRGALHARPFLFRPFVILNRANLVLAASPNQEIIARICPWGQRTATEKKSPCARSDARLSDAVFLPIHTLR